MANLKKILAACAIVVVLVLGAFLYRVFKTPAAASGPITAIPLAANAATSATPSASAELVPTLTSSTTTAAVSVTDETASPSASAQVVPTLTSSTITTPAPVTTTTDTTVTVTANASTAAGTTVFTIIPAQSQVRFSIDEVLDGAPNNVIGTTNQVAGELGINAQDPTKSRVGQIQIDARTLTTDSNFRNRAIKNQILQTDQYEFITFTPTSITGLPQHGTIGQAYTIQILGNLTIRTVTKPVQFAVTVTATSATQLKGTAKATIKRADFNLTIPQVRQVASVGDQVQLTIDFVANAK